MNTYKLKKVYPGLPKDWEIGMEVGLGCRIYGYSPCNGKYTNWYINNDIIKNNPEFWEKVVEKDYEILSFISENNIIHTKRENGKFLESHISGEGFYLESGYSLPDYYINSVKRLSDNTIWAIGDKYQVVDPIKEIRTIATFYISKNKLYITPREYGYSELKEIQIVKQPIYKTEDNVEIFEGDDVHWVNTYNYTYLYPLPFSTGAPKLLNTVGNIYKVFSTKEKAEEYIIMNKPCLSINDVLSVGQRVIVDEGKLKQIVKSKI